MVVEESHSLNTEKMVFSKTDFMRIHWEEKFREFELGGKLFDVSKIKKTEDGFEVYCVKDSEEESIIAIFKEWKKSNLPLSKTKIQFQPLFHSISPLEIEYQNLDELMAVSAPEDNYRSARVKILSPPPR